ncbi:MAG: hypothetical protein ABUS79_07435 [Pseudomonadota bacterium]
MKLSRFLGLAGSIAIAAGCTGTIGGVSNPAGGGGAGGSTSVDPGTVTVPPVPFEPATAQSSVRKVKNLLTGLAPTDGDVATVTTMGAAGLQTLINSWMTQAETKANFQDKMLFFFRNTFQQTGFNPAEDFKPQLLTNGGFDFQTTPGDDIFPRLVQNLEDSFALTAWQLVADGRPFNEVLTTRRFRMTTALKATYLQIEMPRDTRGNAAPTVSWKVDESGNDIPLEQTLDPSSPNFMVFPDVAPTIAGRVPTLACRGTAGMVNSFTGFNTLFQVLLGLIPQFNAPDAAGVNMTVCDRHASKPIITLDDVSDWQWVTIRALNAGEARLMPYNLPALRKATELALTLPRAGFYTTPAFLALWNTNDSNQHRVTANQTLLVALGQSFSPADAIIPFSAAGLDANHAVDGSECYACHKALDPMRQFWGTQLDYNDRNDFPARAGGGLAANPRPAATGGGFAFGSMNTTGASMNDFGGILSQVTDQAGAEPINRFAMAMTQKLCAFANSSQCLESDPEFRRVAKAFESSNYSFAALIKELFSSPLVTGARATKTAETTGLTVSISRRDQLCTTLSTRLGKPDLCGLVVPVPNTTQAATLRIATSVPADAFSRGSEFPITASDPTLFYSAATEMLCENIAVQVVDATTGSVYSSADPDAAIADMVQKIMGYPPSDPAYPSAVQILRETFDAHRAAKATATNSMRSTFALACESPTSLSFGL